MHEDLEVDPYLRQFRPVGPEPALRARILSAACGRRAWPWIAAAAALLCVSVALHDALDRRAAMIQGTPEAPLLGARVDRITNLLDAGEESRRIATFIVTADEIARQANQIEEAR
jgi:hypothetical protein